MSRRKVFFALIAVLLVFVSAQDLSPVDVGEVPGGIYQTLQYLEHDYYAPDSVDQAKLLNIALVSIQKELLVKKNITIDITPIAPDQPDTVAWKEFSELWISHIAQYENKDHQLEFVAIDSMLNTFNDSHTHFLAPQEFSLSQKENENKGYGGIGAILIAKDQEIFIEEIFPGTPADSAGILPLDQIIKVDGDTISSLENTADRIRGKYGTPVVIMVLRKGQVYDITVIRKIVQHPTLTLKLIKKNDKRILYVRVYRFSLSPYIYFPELLTLQFGKYTPVSGIIIDVRDNPGGFLENVYDFLDLFLPEGVDLYTIKSRTVDTTVATRRNQVYPHPLVVLINKYSASGSEIFSGVLQEKEQGIVIGQQSMGHVSVGHEIEISNYNMAVMITKGQFFTAGGKKLEGVGVIPDIEVERTTDNIINGKDPQLEKAVETLITIIDNEKP